MRNKTGHRRLSLWKMVRIVLLIAIVGSALQETSSYDVYASATTFPSNTVEQHSSDDTRKNDGSGQPFDQVALLELSAKAGTLHPSDFYKNGSIQRSAVSVYIRRVQGILIGGILLTLGVMFIPSLLPKISRSRKRVPPSTPGSSPNTRETSQKWRIHPPRSDRGEKNISAIHFKDSDPYDNKSGKNESIAPNEEVEEGVETVVQHEGSQNTDCSPKLECSSLNSQVPQPSTVRAAKIFFQQGGFEVTEHSETRWVVHTTSSKYQGYGKIPIFIISHPVLDGSLVSDVYHAIKTQGYEIKKKIAFVVVEGQLSTAIWQEIYKYKLRYKWTMIPVSHRLIAKSIRNSTCAQAVEKVISLAAKLYNLYDINTPVEDPLDFFGRSEVSKKLLDAVSHQQHIGLFGLRKIGKTSLIWQFREQLSQHIVAYVDLQHVPRDCTYLYHTIFEECVRDASFKYPTLDLPAFNFVVSEGAENQSVQFIQALISFWKCLRAQCHDIKILLLLDEAEHFVPSLAESNEGFSGFHEFMGVIRGISQQYGFLVSIIVSSNPEISRIDTWKGQVNPGFQYYKEVFLSSLSEEESNHLIATIGAQIGLMYTEESLSRIFYETGGHPYIIRQLCSLLAHNLKKQNAIARPAEGITFEDDAIAVQVKDVETAVLEYIEYKNDYLESIWQRLSPIEQEILLTISSNDSCALEDLIANEHSYQTKRERRKAISTLIENGVIEKCENKYSVMIGLIEQFLLTSN